MPKTTRGNLLITDTGGRGQRTGKETAFAKGGGLSRGEHGRCARNGGEWQRQIETGGDRKRVRDKGEMNI